MHIKKDFVNDGVVFLSSSSLGVCLFFSATQKAGKTKDYSEVLENSS